MKQYYFYHNGRQITSGTILKFKPYCIDYFWKLYTEEVTFIWYEPNTGFYYIQVGNRGERIPKDKFDYYFIAPTITQDVEFINQQKANEDKSSMTFMEELQIDGMFLAWLWLIFLLAITFIFKGFYIYWAVIIAVFICYRSSKIQQSRNKRRR